MSDQQRELYKLLQKLLNYVFMFTLIKEKYVYSTALQEAERIKRCEEAERNGMDIPDEDLVSQINQHSIEQIEDIHSKFFEGLKKFKEQLTNINMSSNSSGKDGGVKSVEVRLNLIEVKLTLSYRVKIT